MSTRADHVFASGLPEGLDDDRLKALFGQYGAVLWCKLFKGQGKVAALLQFSSAEEAQGIVDSLNGTLLDGSLSEPVTLEVSSGKKSWSKGGGKGKGRPISGPGGLPLFQPGAAGRPLPQGLPLFQPGGANGRPSPYPVAPSLPSSLVTQVEALTGLLAPLAKTGVAAVAGASSSIQSLKKDLEADGTLPGGQWQNDEGALHIGGLPPDTTERDLYEILSPFGPIALKGLKVMMGPDGLCSGVAFVNYLDPAAAMQVIAVLNNRVLRDGRTLHVTPKKRKL